MAIIDGMDAEYCDKCSALCYPKFYTLTIVEESYNDVAPNTKYVMSLCPQCYSQVRKELR